MKTIFLALSLSLSFSALAGSITFKCQDVKSGEEVKVKQTFGALRRDRTVITFNDGEKVKFSNEFKTVENPVLYQLSNDDVSAEGTYRSYGFHKTKGFFGGKTFEWDLYIENKLFEGGPGKIHFTYFFNHNSLLNAIVTGRYNYSSNSYILDLNCNVEK